MLLAPFHYNSSDVVSDKNSIVMWLQLGISKNLQVRVIQYRPIFTATAHIHTLIGMFFKKRRNIELIFFDSYLLITVPIEHSEDGSLVLTFQFLVDDSTLDDRVAKDNEEVGQKDRKGTDK